MFVCCLAFPAPAQAGADLHNIDYRVDRPVEAVDGSDGEEDAVVPGPAAPTIQLASLTYSEDNEDEGAAYRPAGRREVGPDSSLRLSFGEHASSIQWELGAVLAYMTAINLVKIADRGSSSFSFRDEGLFGKDTINLGIDKLSHAHNAYVLSELIGARIRKKTGTTRGTAVSGALLASGVMLYSELFDGIKATSGFGVHDLLFNSLGAGFSVVRSTTPGLDDKLDFRVLVVPNRNIYSYTGREHYRQLRYLFALKLAGFEELQRTPLRFVELHAGYYAKGFTDREIARGAKRERKPFVGVGVNLDQLLFGAAPRTRAARAASQALHYWQPPYTSFTIK